MCLSRLRNCRNRIHSERSNLVYRKPSRESKTEIAHRKLPVWCAVQANGVVCLDYFNDETVRKVDYHQVLDRYVLSKTQQLPQNSASQQDGAVSHFICTVCCILCDMLASSCTGRYGPTGWPGRSPDLTLLGVSSADSCRNECIGA